MTARTVCFLSLWTVVNLPSKNIHVKNVTKDIRGCHENVMTTLTPVSSPFNCRLFEAFSYSVFCQSITEIRRPFQSKHLSHVTHNPASNGILQKTAAVRKSARKGIKRLRMSCEPVLEWLNSVSWALCGSCWETVSDSLPVNTSAGPSCN